MSLGAFNFVFASLTGEANSVIKLIEPIELTLTNDKQWLAKFNWLAIFDQNLFDEVFV